MTLEERLEINGYDISDFSKTLKLDGFDDAVIAVTSDFELVYDYDKMVQIAMEQNWLAYDEATEFLEYNVLTVKHGDFTDPKIVYLLWKSDDYE